MGLPIASFVRIKQSTVYKLEVQARSSCVRFHTRRQIYRCQSSAFSIYGSRRGDKVDICNVRTSAVADIQGATSQLKRLKLELLLEIASTNRGALANSSIRDRINAILIDLEQLPLDEAPVQGQPATLDGEWELIYSDVEQFRSSPFFWAFQNGLIQSQPLAEAIFRFTDSIPGATGGSGQDNPYSYLQGRWCRM
eukprot:jgi/Botrbrau1/10741/Bobra.180_2s0009.1